MLSPCRALPQRRRGNAPLDALASLLRPIRPRRKVRATFFTSPGRRRSWKRGLLYERPTHSDTCSTPASLDARRRNCARTSARRLPNYAGTCAPRTAQYAAPLRAADGAAILISKTRRYYRPPATPQFLEAPRSSNNPRQPGEINAAAFAEARRLPLMRERGRPPDRRRPRNRSAGPGYIGRGEAAGSAAGAAIR